MLSKLQAIAARYDELTELLSRSETLSDMEAWTKLTKERAEIEEITEAYRDYRKTEEEMQAAFFGSRA